MIELRRSGLMLNCHRWSEYEDRARTALLSLRL